MDELELLREQLRKMMNELSDHMSTGGCKEYSEYTRCCGMIEGLATAERELLDLKKKLEEA
jgi:hypothetical protein|tara:strand:- start:492 stop:674 length:183 start_codon:yes stop_codon:yes gene_type:complete